MDATQPQVTGDGAGILPVPKGEKPLLNAQDATQLQVSGDGAGTLAVPEGEKPLLNAQDATQPQVSGDVANSTIPVPEGEKPQLNAQDATQPQVSGDGTGTLAVPEGEKPLLSAQEPSAEITKTNDELDAKLITEEQTVPEPVTEETNINVDKHGEWQNKEQELMQKAQDLQKEMATDKPNDKMLEYELKVRKDEIELLKARVKNLETELQAAMSKPGAKNHEMIENIKKQHEDLLTKARGMIFDKTKMVKNQELQIAALNTQVQSLKDINCITKDLLEIRNSEVQAMQERLDAMESRFKAEKERYDLVLQRASTSTNINQDLRKEYETQLAIFKELREKYEQRVQALIAENNRLKESLTGPSG